MLPSRNLKWVTAGLRCGHERFAPGNSAYRQFSIHASNFQTPRPTRSLPISRHGIIQQSRSISLFGWGSSSAPDPATGSSVANVEIGPTTPGLNNVRAVKASLSTSDAPDPSQSHFHTPNDVEPRIIEDLQEKLTLPHGDTSERIADIANGDIDITAASERMGYLKEVCGLDFGWGPTSVMETLFEYLHVSGGLSWTASIIAMATILRVALIKPMVDSQIQGKKMREMQPFVQPLRQKYMQLMQEGNRSKAMEIGMQMKEINKSANISYTRAFVPLLIQVPFSFGAFRVLRNAGQLPVPAFVTENWLWTTDLSFSDPYFITPAVSAAAIYFTFKIQQQGQTNTMFGPQMMQVLTTALPIISFAFMAFQPGSVQLYFVTTGIWALITAYMLRQPWFRHWTNLGPLPGSAPLTTTSRAISDKPQSISPKAPFKIQRIQTTDGPKPIDSTPAPEDNRSVIDKAVDGVKGQWKNLSSLTSESSAFGKKVKDKQAEQKKAAAARYQATRQMQLDQERQTRNQQAREGKP